MAEPSPSVDPLQKRICYVLAPDRSGRHCDKPAGHDGSHWTYGGDTLTWPIDPPSVDPWASATWSAICALITAVVPDVHQRRILISEIGQARAADAQTIQQLTEELAEEKTAYHALREHKDFVVQENLDLRARLAAVTHQRREP